MTIFHFFLAPGLRMIITCISVFIAVDIICSIFTLLVGHPQAYAHDFAMEQTSSPITLDDGRMVGLSISMRPES